MSIVREYNTDGDIIGKMEAYTKESFWSDSGGFVGVSKHDMYRER
jgi:hypothetical protein